MDAFTFLLHLTNYPSATSIANDQKVHRILPTPYTPGERQNLQAALPGLSGHLNQRLTKYLANPANKFYMPGNLSTAARGASDNCNISPKGAAPEHAVPSLISSYCSVYMQIHNFLCHPLSTPIAIRQQVVGGRALLTPGNEQTCSLEPSESICLQSSPDFCSSSTLLPV